jgi:hypothetical protein
MEQENRHIFDGAYAEVFGSFFVNGIHFTFL